MNEEQSLKTRTIIKTIIISVIAISTIIFVTFIKNIVLDTILLLIITISIIVLAINNNAINELKENLYKKNTQQSNDTYKYKNIQEQTNKKYTKKESLLTDCEKYFYSVLNKNFNDNFNIIPQVPLSAIISKEKEYKNEYQNELNRIIDFGIFSKTGFKPLLLIEINDKSHLQLSRKERDLKVKQICEEADLKIITFWTNCENTENYIVKRIKEVLGFWGE